jgi:hypothetical protein
MTYRPILMYAHRLVCALNLESKPPGMKHACAYAGRSKPRPYKGIGRLQGSWTRLISPTPPSTFRWIVAGVLP